MYIKQNNARSNMNLIRWKPIIGGVSTMFYIIVKTHNMGENLTRLLGAVEAALLFKSNLDIHLNNYKYLTKKRINSAGDAN